MEKNNSNFKTEETENRAFSYSEEQDDRKAFSYQKETENRAFSYFGEEDSAGEFSNQGESVNRAFSYMEEEKVHSNIFLEEKQDHIQEMKEVDIQRRGMIESVIRAEVVPEMENGNFSLELVGIRYDIRELAEGEYRESWQKSYRFRIRVAQECVEKNVKVTDLYNFNWVHMATDGLAFISEKNGGQLFREYVHRIVEENCGKVPIERYYYQNGWKELGNGEMVYVYEGGIVGNPTKEIWGGVDFKFEVEEEDRKENFKKYYFMEEVCKRKSVSRTLMVFAALSVMSTLFERAGFPVKFIVGVLGTTNTLKTSMTLVFTRIFNAKKVKNPEITFSSTQSGIETMVATYADSILMVDDFMPAENKKKQAELNSKLELLCRLYGDRAPKKRMTDFAGKKVEYPVKGCCIFTGEHLTGVESSRTRILALKIERGDVKKDILSFYQKNSLILPTYLYGFIEFLEQHVNDVIELIERAVEEYRKQADYSIARLNETQAILLTTVDIMEWYWKTSGFISEKDERAREWKESIYQVVSENDQQLAEHNLAEVILMALAYKCSRYPEIIRKLEEITNGDCGLIYEDEEFLYVQNKELYLITKEYCQQFDLNFYLQESMIMEKLKENGVLECVKNAKGHIECSRKLKQGLGISRRFLYLRKRRVQEILEKDAEG